MDHAKHKSGKKMMSDKEEKAHMAGKGKGKKAKPAGRKCGK